MAFYRGHRPAGHESRVFRVALAGGLPAVAVACWLLWSGDHPLRVRLTFGLLAVAAWLVGALLVRERVVRPLQTISNLLAALREGDYSIRARGANAADGLGLALLEVNALSETLRSQRLGRSRPRRCSGASSKRWTQRSSPSTATGGSGWSTRRRASPWAAGRAPARARCRESRAGGVSRGRVASDARGGVSRRRGRWEVRSGTFRQDGLPHQLLVLTDLSRVLRAEERTAWQRIVRVLGHEINNSLAPIKSIAGSLSHLVARERRPPDWEQDLRSGLQVIEARSEALGRFMSAYARLARLPQPRLGPVQVGAWVQRVAALETRLLVRVQEGPVVVVTADGDQLDQLLINLVHNATDASLETGGAVGITWSTRSGVVEVTVEDDGPGLPDPGNLFVPFFTTKANGSGIGLVLCRQIAEAHGGALALEQRKGARGARARLRLPLGPLMAGTEG